MINHPITFHRDFRHYCSSFEDGAKKVMTALPLLSFYRPFRGPLSVGFSAIRTITHGLSVKQHFENGEPEEGLFHFLHAALAASAVALFFFQPVFTFIFSSVSDLILNFREFIESVQKNDWGSSLQALGCITLDCLFLLSICYGLIEITVACMALQIAFDLYFSAKHFYKGEFFEGACHALLAGGRMHQMLPQLKLMLWTWDAKPTFTGTLRQDERGFVYLDLPDEDLRALEKLYHDQNMELPPYFGKGRAGAHVSVMMTQEVRENGGFCVDEVGKEFTFRIVSYDAVKPDRMAHVDRVHFLTLDCPELESLREQYGLSNKINGHDFHFTFGIERAC